MLIEEIFPTQFFSICLMVDFCKEVILTFENLLFFCSEWTANPCPPCALGCWMLIGISTAHTFKMPLLLSDKIKINSYAVLSYQTNYKQFQEKINSVQIFKKIIFFMKLIEISIGSLL